MNCQDCGKAISREDSYRQDILGGHHLPVITCIPCVETVELATGGIIREAVLAIEQDEEESFTPLRARSTPWAEVKAKRAAQDAAQNATSPTERQGILDEARQIVSVDRNGAYGEPETNQGRIAALWTIYLEQPITPRQAAMCLALVKVAREIHAPKRDNLVDICGYAAVAGEL